jgi:hypothetical protein
MVHTETSYPFIGPKKQSSYGWNMKKIDIGISLPAVMKWKRL